MSNIEKLKAGLDLSITKNNKERASSLAITANGREYLGALIDSDTHLLNISSEQISLALSTSAADYPVQEVITMFEGNFVLSPIVIKILVDYVIRTHTPLKYSVVNTKGDILFDADDVQTIFSLYRPEEITISKIRERYSLNIEKANSSELKKYALKGLERNFPLYDSASSYGSAVYTKSGNIYYAGQYSSPDKRLNLHSEMVAILTAIMSDDKGITEIGIASTKYPDSPCNMCGICRQFISEISAKLNISPELYCFTEKTDEFKKWSIQEYLPNSWSSKKMVI